MATCLKIIMKNDEFPLFSLPNIIGFYSVDENRQFCSSSKNLMYLSRPNRELRIDLNVGFEEQIPNVETLENEEKINILLQWMYHSKYLRNLSLIKEPEYTFVCLRGLLTTIMRTPYEKQDDWFIGAVKVKNIIFLCAFHTDDKKAKIQAGITEKDKRFKFWGRKFEQYMLTDDPCRKPIYAVPLNANEQFSLVFRAKINDHHLIYGGETDGIASNKLSDPDSQLMNVDCCQFVELKTSRIIQNFHQDRNFKKFKLLKWWSQSFLVGIQKIICGFRNDDGIVCRLQDFKTSDLPNMAKKFWSPCVCMRFLDDFLNFVKTIMKNEPDMSQWRFDWKPNWTRVTAHKMTPCRMYKIIPDWFLKECKNFTSMCE